MVSRTGKPFTARAIQRMLEPERLVPSESKRAERRVMVADWDS
ncbi:MAG: hypothetical protein AAF533_28530 [Acidobacteriota bacterium]